MVRSGIGGLGPRWKRGHSIATSTHSHGATIGEVSWSNGGGVVARDVRRSNAMARSSAGSWQHQNRPPIAYPRETW